MNVTNSKSQQGWPSPGKLKGSRYVLFLALLVILVVNMLSIDYWKEIPSLDFNYEASFSGFIKRKKFVIAHPHSGTMTINECVLKQKHEKDGYKIIRISKNGKRKVYKVHRLVAEAFYGRCPYGMECCHNNGIKDFNRGSNVRWDTTKENRKDMVKHGTLPIGQRNGHAILKEGEAWLIKKIAKARILYDREIAAIFKVTREVVNAIKLEKSWKHLEV